MGDPRVRRSDVTDALRRALEPTDYVLAMWEGGAAAFDRVDEWSDIDLQVLCEDGRVDDVFEDVRRTLESLSPIEASFRFPEPTWHGHSQACYKLRDASEYLLLDFVAMQKGNDRDRFLQPEIHGRAVIHFDKGESLTFDHVDPAAHAESVRARVKRHREIYDMFKPFVRKELNRRNSIEAMGYYQSMVLRPLVELLRIVHSPMRYNFYTRYVHYEFPQDVVRRLEALFYVSDMEDLVRKCDEADAWVDELLETIGEGPSDEEIAEAAQRSARE